MERKSLTPTISILRESKEEEGSGEGGTAAP
jgi:hypothetical protein